MSGAGGVLARRMTPSAIRLLAGMGLGLLASVAASPAQAQETQQDALGVLGWCTFLPGGGSSCHGDPIEACKVQYDTHAIFTNGFQGAQPRGEGGADWDCLWVDFVYPAYVSFTCASGYMLQMPFQCVAEDEQPTDDCAVGNPIELISGRKYQMATDYETADGLLSVRRHYTSRRANQGLLGGTFQYGGSGWSFDFGPQIELARNFGSDQRVWLNLPDGLQYAFVYDGGLGTFRLADTDADPLRKSRFTVELTGGVPSNWASLNTASSEWVVFDRQDGATYTLTTRKRPAQANFFWGTASSIEFRGGYEWTFTHGAEAEILSVEDSFGRTLDFEWHSGRGLQGTHAVLISKITLPDGTSLNYSYRRLYQSILGSAPINWFDILTSVEHLEAGPTPDTISETTYHYEDGRFPFHLTGVTDARNERFASWSYDNRGRGTSSSHGAGTDTHLVAYTEPNASTRVRTVTNPLGKDAIYTFTKEDSSWLLQSIEGQPSANCVASDTVFTHDDKLVETVTDEEGRVTFYERNGDGLPVRITQAHGTPDARITELTWRSDRQVATMSVPGLTRTFGYDGSARLVSVVETDTTTHTVPYSSNGQTRSWAMAYSPEGLLLSVDGPLAGTADSTVYTYDADGYLASVTDAAGLTTTIAAVDANGRPTRLVDPNGIETELTYSDAGHLEEVRVDPAGFDLVTILGYDEVGNLTSIERADGSAFTYTYDASRRLMAIEDAAGSRIVYVRDAMGNVTSTQVIDGASNIRFSQTAVFDELGRLLASIGAGAETWSYAYDRAFNLVSATDPRGGTLDFAYNGLNELVQTIDQSSSQTDLERDGQGGVVVHDDPRGIETGFVRNGWGEIIAESSPDIGTIVYERDARGQVVRRTDARSIVTDYTYDAAGRLTDVAFPAASGEGASFSYDQTGAGNQGAGRLTGFSDEVGDTDITYNAVGLVSSETVWLLGTFARTGYQYDDAGNLALIEYPSGRQISYWRDADGEISSVAMRRAGGQPLVDLAYHIGWQPFGDVRTMTFGNGLNLWRTFDQNYRDDQLGLYDGGSAVFSRYHGYLDDLNLTHIWDTITPSESQSYWYSPNNMLQNADGPWGEDLFYHDGVGNRTWHETDDGSVVTIDHYDYSSAHNRLVAIWRNGTMNRSFTYDAAGNVATDTQGGVTTAYTYNHAGRLTTVTRGGVVRANYTYNARGQLVLREVVNSPNAGTTVYFYDQAGRVLAEYDGATATLQREYVWLEDRPVAVIDPGPSGDRISYVHADHLNRPIAMTNASKAVVAEFSWLPHGGLHSYSGTADLDLRFPGQLFQAESGLHYNWFRQYDPTTGRYTQPDPLGLVAGPNRYSYANNSPLQFVDPDGALPVLLLPAAGSVAPGIASGLVWIGGGIAAGAAGVVAGGWIGDLLYPPAPVLAEPNPGQCTTDFIWQDYILPAAGGPGKPGPEEGYFPPKRWDGRKVYNPNGRGYGYPDREGRVWVPVGGQSPHGGPHWDVQDPRTGKSVNVHPGGHRR